MALDLGYTWARRQDSLWIPLSANARAIVAGCGPMVRDQGICVVGHGIVCYKEAPPRCPLIDIIHVSSTMSR
ncbi:hypothetical protein CCZ28_19970 [Pseudomonas oryzihabitans]|nr:hypothetical protein CCZ28_19970 [Pseudomonas psychrotolerans]